MYQLCWRCQWNLSGIGLTWFRKWPELPPPPPPPPRKNRYKKTSSKYRHLETLNLFLLKNDVHFLFAWLVKPEKNKNWTMPVLRHTTTTAPDLMSNSSSAAAANITATTKFINEAINQLHHMMDWTVQHVVHLLKLVKFFKSVIWSFDISRRDSTTGRRKFLSS